MTDYSSTPVPLLPWWEEWDRRLEQELRQFERRGLSVTLLEDPRAGADRLVVETQVPLPDSSESTRILVVYPDGFPNRRFAVYAPDLELARHQAPGGNLCVFPRDPKFWHPTFLAGNVVADDVPNLIRLVETGGDELREQEDPQGEPFTTFYGGIATGGVVVDQRALALTLQEGAGGEMSVGFAQGQTKWLEGIPDPLPEEWTVAVGQGLLVGLSGRDGSTLLNAPDQALAARFGRPQAGRWTYLPVPPRVESAEDLWEAVTAADNSLARWADTSSGMQLVGLCTQEEVQQGVYELAWVFLARVVEETAPRGAQARSRNPARRRSVRKENTPNIVRSLRWTPDDLAARIPELQGLRAKTVSVVGLGSLGAPLAQELVKARVGELRVTDFDHIDAGTSVRYPLGLSNAGLDKGLALVLWAQEHNPEVTVRPHGLMIGAAAPERSGRTEREALHTLLDGTDLMVSATAEHDINRQLDAVAARMDVPRLFMWSMSGYGGIVALLEKGRTGCFHCFSLFESREAEAGNPLVQVPPPVNDQPAGTIQGRGCADKTFTANHADLLPLSNQAARLTFGRLTPSEQGYPAFADDIFAVQMREPNGQPIPPRWTSFKLPPDPECPNCRPA